MVLLTRSLLISWPSLDRFFSSPPTLDLRWWPMSWKTFLDITWFRREHKCLDEEISLIRWTALFARIFSCKSQAIEMIVSLLQNKKPFFANPPHLVYYDDPPVLRPWCPQDAVGGVELDVPAGDLERSRSHAFFDRLLFLHWRYNQVLWPFPILSSWFYTASPPKLIRRKLLDSPRPNLDAR